MIKTNINDVMTLELEYKNTVKDNRHCLHWLAQMNRIKRYYVWPQDIITPTVNCSIELLISKPPHTKKRKLCLYQTQGKVLYRFSSCRPPNALQHNIHSRLKVLV